MTDVEILGKEVKRIRDERGISVKELAEKSDVNEQTIRKLEAGKNILAVPFIRICIALGVKPVYTDTVELK